MAEEKNTKIDYDTLVVEMSDCEDLFMEIRVALSMCEYDVDGFEDLAIYKKDIIEYIDNAREEVVCLIDRIKAGKYDI